MQEVYISLNKKRPSSLDEMIVTNFEIGGSPPEIIGLKQVQTKKNQFLYDFEIRMKSKILFEFETNIIINWPKVFDF